MADVRAWEDWMVGRNLSPATRRNYRYHLITLVVETLLEPSEIAEEDLMAYVRALRERGNGPGQTVRAARSFFGWAARKRPELYPENPADDLRVRGPRWKPADFLTSGEIVRVLSAAARHHPRRGWALVLGLETGARIGSLAGLRAEDCATDPGGFIQFNVAKGDRPYVVEATPVAAAAVRGLLANPPARTPRRDTLLGVTKNTVWAWYHEAAKAARLPSRKWRAHIMRSTFCTRLLERDVPERVVQELMNHADLSQLRPYAAVTRRRTAEAMRTSVIGEE